MKLRLAKKIISGELINYSKPQKEKAKVLVSRYIYRASYYDKPQYDNSWRKIHKLARDAQFMNLLTSINYE